MPALRQIVEGKLPAARQSKLPAKQSMEPKQSLMAAKQSMQPLQPTQPSQPKPETMKSEIKTAPEKRSEEGGVAGTIFVKVLSLVAGRADAKGDGVPISEMPITSLQFASYVHDITPSSSSPGRVLTRNT